MICTFASSSSRTILFVSIISACSAIPFANAFDRQRLIRTGYATDAEEVRPSEIEIAYDGAKHAPRASLASMKSRSSGLEKVTLSAQRSADAQGPVAYAQPMVVPGFAPQIAAQPQMVYAQPAVQPQVLQPQVIQQVPMQPGFAPQQVVQQAPIQPGFAPMLPGQMVAPQGQGVYGQQVAGQAAVAAPAATQQRAMDAAPVPGTMATAQATAQVPVSTVPAAADGGGGMMTNLFFLVILGIAAVAIVPIIMNNQQQPQLGRVAEVPQSAADVQVWATSKARQTYRKSVLQAQNKDSDSEEDSRPAAPQQAAAFSPAKAVAAAAPATEPATGSYRERASQAARKPVVDSDDDVPAPKQSAPAPVAAPAAEEPAPNSYRARASRAASKVSTVSEADSAAAR